MYDLRCFDAGYSTFHASVLTGTAPHGLTGDTPTGQADSLFQGGLSSNRPPPNSKSTLVTGGEDTAEIGLFVKFVAVAQFLAGLKMAKEEAQLVGSGEEMEITFGKSTYLMQPTGKFVEGGPTYAYRIVGGGFTFLIMNREEWFNDTPNVIVQVGSRVLMEADGIEGVWEDIKRRLKEMKGFLYKSKVCRVDACVDLVGEDIDTICLKFANNHKICRARKGSLYFDGLRKTGFDLGEQTRIRIYDKLLEASEEKKEILVERRWGEVPDSAVRVEFQLRRKSLKSFGVESVEDWIRERAKICKYLTGEWFRLTKGEVDRANTTRQENCDFWKRVQVAFEKWAGRTLENVRRVKPRKYDDKALRKQAVGCVLGVIASEIHKYSSVRELRGAIHRVIEKGIKELGEKLIPKHIEKCEKLRLKLPEIGPLLGDEGSFRYGFNLT